MGSMCSFLGVDGIEKEQPNEERKFKFNRKIWPKFWGRACERELEQQGFIDFVVVLNLK